MRDILENYMLRSYEGHFKPIEFEQCGLKYAVDTSITFLSKELEAAMAPGSMAMLYRK